MCTFHCVLTVSEDGIVHDKHLLFCLLLPYQALSVTVDVLVIILIFTIVYSTFDII